MRLLMPEAYSGWRLKALQDVLDDLSHPWLLRHPMSPYNLHFQKLQELRHCFGGASRDLDFSFTKSLSCVAYYLFLFGSPEG